jgi:hypothetical protein
LKEEHEYFIHIYTDGSKEDCKVGTAVFENNFSSSMRLPDNASLFTAEAIAIEHCHT